MGEKPGGKIPFRKIKSGRARTRCHVVRYPGRESIVFKSGHFHFAAGLHRPCASCKTLPWQTGKNLLDWPSNARADYLLLLARPNRHENFGCDSKRMCV